MRVDVSQLLKELGREDKLDQSYRFNFADDSFKLTLPVRMKLKLIGIKTGVVVEGSVWVELILNCARCGKEFKKEINFEIEEEYILPHIAVGKDDIFADEAVFLIEDEKYIDLTEAVRQAVIINLPLKPICETGCHIDKSEKKAKGIDPRLEKLKELKG